MDFKFSKTVKALSYFTLFLAPILSVLLVIYFKGGTLVSPLFACIVCVFLEAALFFLIVYVLISKKTGRPVFLKKIPLVFAGLVTVACVAFCVLLYGPFTGFKNWLITTAMSTMSHQHYCQWFYSEKEINSVLGQNYVEEVDEKTDTDMVESDADKNEQAEKIDDYIAINKAREEADAYNASLTEGVVAETSAYKLIRLRVNGQVAYLACVYDASKVQVAYTNKMGQSGQYVTKMAELKGALLGINGAGFYDPGANSSGATPGGLTIAGGQVITNNGFHGYSGGGLIGFNNENVLCLMKNATAESALAAGIRDAVSWGPFLVVNGKSSYVSGNGGWGLAARTAIGQTADGTVLLLVVDSNSTRSKGATMKDLADIMISYGAVNAANLDGGTSTVMVMPSDDALAVNSKAKTDGYSTKYRIINDPVDSALQHKTRPIADAWVVLP